jgi:hypothetical protein
MMAADAMRFNRDQFEKSCGHSVHGPLVRLVGWRMRPAKVAGKTYCCVLQRGFGSCEAQFELDCGADGILLGLHVGATVSVMRVGNVCI